MLTYSLFSGSNFNNVKLHNLRAVLLTLLYEGGVSRVELARRTSLSNTTITNLIAELLDQGIVVEEGQQEMPPAGSRIGRPRTALRLEPNARFAVGVHIGIGVIRVSIANLAAEILHNRVKQFPTDQPAEEVLDDLVDLIDLTILESGVERERLIGIGVGASGLVDYVTGVNVLAPNLCWRDVPIRDLLMARTGLPVVVDNNVRTMALGEALYGAGRGVNVLAFVYGRIGVGAGFVVGGQIFHGSAAGAGEIGHATIIPEGGPPCRCGNTGCLETLVSETALVEQAAILRSEDPGGILAQFLQNEDGGQPIERIFAAARAGDEPTRRMLEKRGHYLGIALANLVNILNPELIILGGIFAQGHDLLLPSAEATMRQRAFAGLGDSVRLQITSFGWRAGVTGAGVLALTSFFYHPSEGLTG